MSFQRYLNRIERLDALIRRRSTGPPKKLAWKLGISERWLYRLLEELRDELGCPIRYCRRSCSYYYSVPGRLRMGFEEHDAAVRPLDSHAARKTRGGISGMDGIYRIPFASFISNRLGLRTCPYVSPCRHSTLPTADSASPGPADKTANV